MKTLTIISAINKKAYEISLNHYQQLIKEQLLEMVHKHKYELHEGQTLIDFIEDLDYEKLTRLISREKTMNTHENLMNQAPVTAAMDLSDVITHIDDELGKGYAKQQDNERNQIIERINLLFTEQHALNQISKINDQAYISTRSAINYWLGELDMLDLLVFCNTGKYPQ